MSLYGIPDVTSLIRSRDCESSSSSLTFYVCVSVLARVRRFPRNGTPPSCAILRHFSLESKPSHVLHNTFVPSLSAMATTPRACNLNPSTYRHPVVCAQTLHMSKSSQSASSHNLNNAFYSQPLQKLLTRLSRFYRHSTHPSDHHPLCSLQSVHVLHPYSPRFTAIHHDSTNTSFVNLSFHP